MADAKKAFHEQVAEKLIEQLRQGTAPEQRSWEPGEAASLLPINPTTGKRYRGVRCARARARLPGPR
ncbi:MAG: ArdC family protein [Candidatus Accumulibacter phosphatis]|jgi:putative DNA primase/helicase